MFLAGVNVKPKVLIADGLEQAGQDILRLEARVEDRSGILAPDLFRMIHDVDGLIVRSRTQVSGDLIQVAPKLKVVGRAGVGVDNIDLQAAARRSVMVVNAPVATTGAVAELVIGLILALARQIPLAASAMRDGSWLKKELIGSEIEGKKLGVIGMGQIGTAVSQKAAALGMSVLGFDPYLDEVEIARRSARPLPFEQLCSHSDFITLHVPLNDGTRLMINEPAIQIMKTGVRLICTSRGGIVDETALLGALESGKIAGAALDVFQQEPPGQIPLISHPNLIATPHIGAQTLEAQSRAARDIAEEVIAALSGLPLRWRIV